MIEPINATEMSMAFSGWKYRHASKPQRIIMEYAMEYDVTVEALKGPDRHRPLVHVRQEAMDAIHRNTPLSLPQIGRMFNRDHTTVLHALRAVEKRKAMGMDLQSLRERGELP